MLAAHEHVCPDITDRRRTGADCVATFILILQAINTLVLVGLLVMAVLLWLALKAARKEMKIRDSRTS